MDDTEPSFPLKLGNANPWFMIDANPMHFENVPKRTKAVDTSLRHSYAWVLDRVYGLHFIA